MSNRLSDRYPGRAQKNTPHIDSTSTLSPFAERLVGRMQYAPTMPAEKLDLKGWWEVMFGTRRDEYVFNFFMPNRLSDRFPGRGVLHTPHNHSRKGYLIACQTIVGRMQYAPTFPEKDEGSLGRCFPSSRTIRDEYVFHFSMSNRLSDRYPGRGVLHTPHIDSTSIPSPLAGRLVRRMQYAPTLSVEKSDLKGWCGVTFRRRGDEYVFLFSISNRLSDGYPGRGVLHTPPAHLSSTLSPFSGRLVGRMQYAPTPPAEKSDFKGWCGVMFGTRGDSSIRRTEKKKIFLARR